MEDRELEEKYKYIYLNLEDLKFGIPIQEIKKHDLYTFVQRVRHRINGEVVSLYRLTDDYSKYFSRTNPYNNENEESSIEKETEIINDENDNSSSSIEDSSEDSYIEELETKISEISIKLDNNEASSLARVEHKQSRLEFMIKHSNKYAYRVSSKFDKPVRLIYDPERKNMFYRNKNGKITYLKQFFPEDLFWICSCPIHSLKTSDGKHIPITEYDIGRLSAKRFEELLKIEGNKDRLKTQETLHAINVEKYDEEISIIEDRINNDLQEKRNKLIHDLQQYKRSKRK